MANPDDWELSRGADEARQRIADMEARMRRMAETQAALIRRCAEQSRLIRQLLLDRAEQAARRPKGGE